MSTISIRSVHTYHNYFVSADGRVFRELRGNRKDNGYIYVKLTKGPMYDGRHASQRQQRMHFVHRLVAEAWIGPAPSPRHDVDHLDGMRDHNDVTNLEWCTRAENLARARLRGDASKAGEKNPRAKLTEKQVHEIRRQLASGESNIAVAAAFGVTDALISMIRTRKIWTHI